MLEETFMEGLNVHIIHTVLLYLNAKYLRYAIGTNHITWCSQIQSHGAVWGIWTCHGALHGGH